MSDKIRLATSNPSLKEKIYVNIDDGDLSNVYWYIRFNIPLDDETVSHKTTSVTDVKGYIMRTEMSYDEKRNMIVVAPLDSYMENVYYILTITKKVKSLRGNNLKNDTHILFKLKDNQISEYELLKSTVKPPKAVPRPGGYEDMMLEMYPGAVVKRPVRKGVKTPTYSRDVIEFMDIKIDLVTVLPGIILFFVSLRFDNLVLIAISVLLAVASVVYIVRQLMGADRLLSIYYNLGAFNFNRGNYYKAIDYFEKALKVNPEFKKPIGAIERAFAKIHSAP